MFHTAFLSPWDLLHAVAVLSVGASWGSEGGVVSALLFCDATTGQFQLESLFRTTRLELAEFRNSAWPGSPAG